MPTRNGFGWFNTLFCLLPFLLAAQTTLEQALTVVTNEMTPGGSFQIRLQVKGSNLLAANTLGSATVDVTYDNTQLNYVASTSWGFGFTQGYSRSATDNSAFVRVLVTGNGVNENGGGNPPGIEIEGTYETWVQLNFTIANASGTTDLTIDPASNAIGLFENYQNEPNTGVIINQMLTPPIDIIGEPLSVTGINASHETPEHLRLYQNYPNPFNSETYLSYDLLQSTQVLLTIHDLAGRRVQTLVNEFQTAGRYAVKFNAGHIQSGIYFYQLKAGNRIEKSQKMILMR